MSTRSDDLAPLPQNIPTNLIREREEEDRLLGRGKPSAVQQLHEQAMAPPLSAAAAPAAPVAEPMRKKQCVITHEAAGAFTLMVEEVDVNDDSVGLISAVGQMAFEPKKDAVYTVRVNGTDYPVVFLGLRHNFGGRSVISFQHNPALRVTNS